jgi:hypothetical protein
LDEFENIEATAQKNSGFTKIQDWRTSKNQNSHPDAKDVSSQLRNISTRNCVSHVAFSILRPQHHSYILFVSVLTTVPGRLLDMFLLSIFCTFDFLRFRFSVLSIWCVLDMARKDTHEMVNGKPLCFFVHNNQTVYVRLYV